MPRQPDEALEDAHEHVGEAIDALQDGDAPTELIDDAEELFTRISELREE